LANDGNNSKNIQETVTVSKDDSEIKELQKQLKEKTEALEATKKQAEKTIKDLKEKSEIKTNLEAGVIKQDTFGASYKNGYADGTVREAKKKIIAERKKAKAGRK